MPKGVVNRMGEGGVVERALYPHPTLQHFSKVSKTFVDLTKNVGYVIMLIGNNVECGR